MFGAGTKLCALGGNGHAAISIVERAWWNGASQGLKMKVLIVLFR